MRREIVLLDVTDMGGAHVCIAGLDPDSGQQLRLSDPTPTQAMVRKLGGLRPGDVVSIEWQPARRVTSPHVEDGAWYPVRLKKVRRTAFEELSELLARYAFDSVEEAFGAHCVGSGNTNHAWPPVGGERSLATLRVRYVRAARDDRGKVRLAFRDGAGAYWQSVPFQDLQVKIHQTTCDGCTSGFFENVRSDFDGNTAILRIGLARAYDHPDHPKACWLQVTNIFARERGHFL